MGKAKARKVVVTTAHRGVFYGELVSLNAKEKTAILANCRNCIYWSSATKGFLGLAVSGPASGSRIGPASPRTELYDVTSITDCTPEAAVRWEAGPWN